ncbi:MAG: ComEC/Rec2 family competence protein [Candidatus Diapherotrites archaeon]|nr:ComEC/Rec2 family competence protein [Candidatus Diapherotrites archaeon]
MRKRKNKQIYLALILVILIALIGIQQAGFFSQTITNANTINSANTTSTPKTNMNSGTQLEKQALDQNVKIHFIDVGQGDSIWIETGQENILVDAGNTGKGYVVADYLKQHNAITATYLIGTHEDADHIGGLDEVILSGIEYTTYLSPQQDCNTKACRDLDLLIIGKKQKIKRGELLHAKIPIYGLNPIEPLEFEEKNNNAIVLLVNIQDINVLLTSDCEKECEESIVNSGLLNQVQIYKVGHHGSKTSSSVKLLERIQAKVGIISVGANNSYGHPHETVVNRLIEYGLKIYRTDLDGNIVLNTDGKNYTIENN